MPALSSTVSAKLLIPIGILALGCLATSYRTVRSIPIPGDDGWDYLYADSDQRRLYVSHGSEVDVLDLDKQSLVGKIPGLHDVAGIAISHELRRGFVSDGRANQVVVFDLGSLSSLSTPKAGTNPDGIVYDPYSQRVFAFNGQSKDVTVIDGDSGAIAGTIPLGGKPEFPTTDGKGFVFANIEDRNEIIRMNPKTLEVLNHWPIAPCQTPSGLAIDVKNNRLFSVCENKLMAIVDASSGKVIATVPTGAGTDGTAFDPEMRLVFASNGEDGTLTVVKQESADKYTVVQNVKTQRGARTMAVDLKTHKIYLSDASLGATPKPTSVDPHPFPRVLPGTFKLIVVSQ